MKAESQSLCLLQICWSSQFKSRSIRTTTITLVSGCCTSCIWNRAWTAEPFAHFAEAIKLLRASPPTSPCSSSSLHGLAIHPQMNTKDPPKRELTEDSFALPTAAFHPLPVAASEDWVWFPHLFCNLSFMWKSLCKWFRKTVSALSPS